MRVSYAMQRYAAEIYRLQQDHPYATLSMLAEHVDASLQAVSRMLTRLEEGGLLEREPYRGVRLTLAGEKAALPELRRHRLLEVFLVKVMKFGWDEAHDLTDGFALGIDQKLEDRIDDLTGRPTRCPHGEPIPTREGIMPALQDRSLTTLQPGEIGHVSRVRTHDGPKLRYLAEQGLVPGVGFRVVSHAPFNGPIRVLTDKQEHILGHELAQVLWVETLDGELDPNLCNRAGCPLPKVAELYGRLPARK